MRNPYGYQEDETRRPRRERETGREEDQAGCAQALRCRSFEGNNGAAAHRRPFPYKMPAEHPQTKVLSRDEVDRIRGCRVAHAWISATAFADLELHAACRGTTIDRLVSMLVERVALHPGAVKAIVDSA